MGRPGRTCYVLILYSSYLGPYILFHFLYLCVYCRALIMLADERLFSIIMMIPAAAPFNTINMIINHDRQPLFERVE